MRRVFLGILAASLVLIVVALSAAILSSRGGGSSEAAKPPADKANTTPLPTTEAPPLGPTASAGVFAPTGTASGPAEHDGARALALLKELAKSPRVSGTERESAAAALIAEQYRSYGYSTEVMEFSFDGDRFRAGTTTVEGVKYEALTLAGSPGGSVAASAVYVGLADAAGIAGRDLTGKMVVADRGTLNFIDKYANVKAAGAVGLVVVNNKPGPFSGNLTTAATIPVVAVSQEDGVVILAAAKVGKTVGIDAPPTAGATKALNVIARPSPGGECKVLVGGHFDSVPGAPGANDNASGAANVVELARAFAADGLDDGLCFANFGAEESGLYGSKALVERLTAEKKLPLYMVNLDVTGIGNGVEVIGSGEIAQRAISLAKAAGIPAIASELPPNSGSDHQSFLEAGVPTVFLTSGDFPTIHTPQDVSADIDDRVLDEVGDAAYALIKSMLAEVARG